MKYIKNIGINSRQAFENLKKVDHKKIKKVLENFNKSLLKNQSQIIKENLKDVKNIKRKHFLDRLILNKKRIDGIRNSINEIIKFKNPIGNIVEYIKTKCPLEMFEYKYTKSKGPHVIYIRGMITS